MTMNTLPYEEINNIVDTVGDKQARDILNFNYTKLMREYFDGMEIDEEEKKKRLRLAEDLKIALLLFFASVIIDDAMNYTAEAELAIRAQSIARRYMGKDVAYINDYINGKARKVYDITQRHKDDTDNIEIEGLTFENGAYWTSEMRATLTAEDITNAIANYDNLIDAIEAGYTMKTWLDQKDARVRPTHRVAGGQTVPIWEPFIVGGYELMVPCDDNLGAPEEEIANCRCYMKFS